jgi:hypothetical protein
MAMCPVQAREPGPIDGAGIHSLQSRIGGSDSQIVAPVSCCAPGWRGTQNLQKGGGAVKGFAWSTVNSAPGRITRSRLVFPRAPILTPPSAS